ncbi:ficolin-1-like [Anopheles darlingi]|uniref:ficolin-1-like n=1 Tax=Anopheles darlingi TaxID=43151 RepID=UPI0021003B66|nr:ficolin-1-like [Anopheles darlingi]
MVGFKLELLLIKLEKMEHRLQKMESMQLQLQKIQDKIEEHRTTQEQNHKEMISAIQKLENQVELNLTGTAKRSRNRENVQTALHKLDQDVDNVHNFTRQIMNALPQLQQLNAIMQNQFCVTSTEKGVSTTTEVPQPLTTTTTTPKPKQPPFSSCKDVPSNASGTYLLRVNNDCEPFEVYCEQNAFDGGWIVMQFRFDGSLDFYRDWNEFRDGFGDLNKEFWLGLEKVHQITSGRKHELIVELQDFEGTYKYARYGVFEICNESDQFKLKILGNYNGTAGNAMSFKIGNKFLTKDRDNNVFCAQYLEGAWWHPSWGCTNVNLNGRYTNKIDRKSMTWWDFKINWQGLSYSRMMIRELE